MDDRAAERERARLDMLAGVRATQDDPCRFVELVRGCADEAAALAAIETAYGVSAHTATAMLDTSFRRLTARDVHRLADEAASIEQRLAGGG